MISITITLEARDFDTMRRCLEKASDDRYDTAMDDDERREVEDLAQDAADLHSRLTSAMPRSY